jgi:hypothetical protein
MYLGTGVSIPTGDATGDTGDSLGARYAWQVPIEIGLGGKLNDALTLGGYFAASFGAEGSDMRVERACDDQDTNFENEIECSTNTIKLGIEIRYGFQPAAKVNPWLGYGIGLDYAHQSIRDRVRNRSESTNLWGIDWARLGAGLDFRASRAVGIGPAATVAVGRYTRTSTKVNGQEVFDGEVDDPSFHAWVTLALRFVLFP